MDPGTWWGVFGGLIGTAISIGILSSMLRNQRELTRRANVRCPACSWRPPIRPLWLCHPDGCGTLFDTFACRGECPSCKRTFEETACPSCKAWSPHAAWYVEGPPAAPSPQARVQRAAGTLDRCPYCRDHVDPLEGVACASCLARHHPDCWDAHGACSACSGDVRYGQPEQTEGPRRHEDGDLKA